ncbi:hypothetical protein QOT17_016004 [Balamuthia mandrillaris]
MEVSPLLAVLTLALCFLLSCLPPGLAAQRTPISEEDAFAVFNVPGLQIRVVNNSGPAFFAFPTDSSGHVLEDYWLFFSLPYFREYRCTLVNSRSFLRGCNVDTGFYYNLTDPHTYSIVDSRENFIRLRWHGLGGPYATADFVLEAISEEEIREFQNNYGTTKELNVPPNSIKFSIEFLNFTSHVLAENEHFYDGSSGYFTEWSFRINLGLSSLIVPQPWSNYYNPIVADLSTVGSDKVISYVNTVQEGYRVRIGQASFSLNEPPTASLVHKNESLHGFEALDVSIQNWNGSTSLPQSSHFELDVFVVGGKDVIYDPDFSLLLELGDGEDGDEDGVIEDGMTDDGGSDGSAHDNQKESADDDNKAVVIAVSVLVPVLVVLGVVVIALTIFLQRRRRNRQQHKITTALQLAENDDDAVGR